MLWHPGSSSGCHLCLLTSDATLRYVFVTFFMSMRITRNFCLVIALLYSLRTAYYCSMYCCRIYNTLKPDYPYKIMKLSDRSSRFSSALNENFVSMAFSRTPRLASATQSAWPLYLLTGSGAVYLCMSSLWPSDRLVPNADSSLLCFFLYNRFYLFVLQIGTNTLV